MLSMPSFDMNTHPETFVQLIHCIIDRAMPNLRHMMMLPQFIDVINLIKSNQIQSAKLTIAPHHQFWGTCYSRLKIKIHNNYYKVRLGYMLKGRK